MKKPIVSYHESSLYESDLKVLDCGWLSSNAVDFILCHFEQDKYGDALKSDGKVSILHPATTHMISIMDGDDLKECMAPLELETKELLFIPVNNATASDISSTTVDRGSHWSLLVIDRRLFPTVLHYDSSHESNSKVARRLLQKITPLLSLEKPVSFANAQGVAQQENGSDCGVFMCCFVDFLLGQHFGFPVASVNQERVSLLRQQMYELAKSKVKSK